MDQLEARMRVNEIMKKINNDMKNLLKLIPEVKQIAGRVEKVNFFEALTR